MSYSVIQWRRQVIQVEGQIFLGPSMEGMKVTPERAGAPRGWDLGMSAVAPRPLPRGLGAMPQKDFQKNQH